MRPTSAPNGSCRAVRFACFVVLATVLPFMLLEGALRLAGWSHPISLGGHPYVNMLPLFRLEA